MTTTHVVEDATQLFYFPNNPGDIAAALALVTKTPAVTESQLGNPMGRPPAKDAPLATGLRSAQCESVTHIVLGTPLLHPSSFATVARALACSEAELKLLLRAEAWLEEGRVHVLRTAADEARAAQRFGPVFICQHLRALREEGDAAVFVDRVVVPPLGQRPLVPAPGGIATFSLADRALASLVRRAQTLKRLGGAQLLAGATIVAMQEAFEDAYAAVRCESVDLWATLLRGEHDGDDSKVVTHELPNYWPKKRNRATKAQVTGVRFGRRLFITTSDRLYEVDPFTREVLHSQPWPGARLLHVAPDGRRLFCAMPDHSIRVLENGIVRALAPSDADALAAGFVEDHEQSFLVRTTDDRQVELKEVSDYPIFEEWSACGRFVWVHDKEGAGAVYDLTTGRSLFEPRWLAWPATQLPTIHRDSTKVMASGRSGWLQDFEAGTGLGCFTLGSDGGWRLFDGDTMVTLTDLGPRPHLQIARRLGVRAAAFDPNGRHIAIALRDEVWTIELVSGEVVARWTLPTDG